MNPKNTIKEDRNEHMNINDAQSTSLYGAQSDYATEKTRLVAGRRQSTIVQENSETNSPNYQRPPR